MNKYLLVLISIFLVVISSSFISAYYCYQESANVSNQVGIDGDCGLNYSGSYYSADCWGYSGNGLLPNFYDGNWGTSSFSCVGATSNIYINYTKPSLKNDSAIWRVSGSSIGGYGINTLNITILPSCWNYNANILQLKATSIRSGSDGFNIWSCLNASGWNILNQSSPTAHLTWMYLYEEAMIWNITDATLNISASNSSGGSIAAFNVSVFDVNTSVSNSYVASSGNVTIDFIRGHTYTLSYSGSVLQNKVITYVANQSATQSVSTMLMPRNSVNITFIDLNTGLTINQTLNITITSSSLRTTYTTSIGNIIVSALASGINSIEASGVNYSASTYSINVVDGSTQNLVMYLGNVANTLNVSFTFYDPNGAIIPNVFMTEYALINTSYIPVMSDFSDIEGVIYFTYNNAYDYLYNYSADGFVSSSFVLSPPKKSSYAITLQYLYSVIEYSNLNISGSLSYSNITKIATFSYISFESLITNYSYSISKVVGADRVIVCSDSSTALVDSFSCDLTGYDGAVFVQGVANSTTIFFGEYLSLRSLPKLFDNLKPRDAAFLTAFFMAIVIFGALAFGPVGTLIGGVIALFGVFLLGIFTPLTVTLIIVDVIVSLVIAFGLKRRGA